MFTQPCPAQVVQHRRSAARPTHSVEDRTWEEVTVGKRWEGAMSYSAAKYRTQERLSMQEITATLWSNTSQSNMQDYL